MSRFPEPWYVHYDMRLRNQEILRDSGDGRGLVRVGEHVDTHHYMIRRFRFRHQAAELFARIGTAETLESLCALFTIAGRGTNRRGRPVESVTVTWGSRQREHGRLVLKNPSAAASEPVVLPADAR